MQIHKRSIGLPDPDAVVAVDFVFKQEGALISKFLRNLDKLHEHTPRAAELVSQVQAFLTGCVAGGMCDIGELKLNAVVYASGLRRALDEEVAA